MVNVVAAQQAGGLVTVVHAELAPRAVAVGVHERLRHPQLPGDLLGAEMLVHEPQALPFALRQQLDRMGCRIGPHRHANHSKRRLSRFVYLGARIQPPRVVL